MYEFSLLPGNFQIPHRDLSESLLCHLGQYIEETQSCLLSYDGTTGVPIQTPTFEILTGSHRLGTWVTVTGNTIPPNSVLGIEHQSFLFGAF
jgi:hypothetical protein